MKEADAVVRSGVGKGRGVMTYEGSRCSSEVGSGKGPRGYEGSRCSREVGSVIKQSPTELHIPDP